LFYYDDLTIEIDEYRKYTIEINKLATPYACVLRIYPDNTFIKGKFALYNYLPKIIDANGFRFRIMDNISTMQECIQNTNQFTWLYKTLLSFKKIQRNYQEQLFTNFHIPKIPVSIYFTNKRASYLMLHVRSKTDVIKITGFVPRYHKKGIRYFSYMICDGITTVTDDCIGTNEIEKQHNAVYTIFIAPNLITAFNKGYDKSKDKLMIWNEKTTYPIVVYREIRMDNEEFLTKENSIAYVKNKMGNYYPKVEILREL